jgi:hypothetical protein
MEEEVGGTYSTQGRKEKFVQNFSQKALKKETSWDTQA